MLRLATLLLFMAAASIAFVWALGVEIPRALRMAWLESYAPAWHRWREAWRR